KEFGVITTLPNFTKLISSAVVTGKFLQATVGPGLFVTLRLNGTVVKTLPAGSYTISVTDKSAKDNFHITGKGVNKSTSVAKTHCGERQSCSSGAYLAAASIRRLSSSFDSSSPRFVVTSPSTTCFEPFGRKRNGSKPPERSSSHSMKKPSTSSSPKRASATK